MRARNIKKQAEPETTAEEIAAIEALLDNADADVEIELDAPEAVEDEAVDPALVAEVLAESDELSAAYADQDEEATQAIDDVSAVESVVVDASTAYASQGVALTGGKTKRTNGPRIVAKDFVNAVKSLLGPNPTLDLLDAPMAEADVEAFAASITQKKVREKVTNVLQAATKGATPSVYTKIALDLLRDAHAAGSAVKAADIAKAYLAAGYSKGTSASQAGQLASMLPAMKIARKTAAGLVLNPDSVLADALGLVSAAEAA